MINGVNGFNQLSLEMERLRLSKKAENQGQLLQGMKNLQEADSFSFDFSLSRALQISESESRKEINQAMSFDFSISVDWSGKLSARQDEELKTQEDPYSPENTAKRIAEFVQNAYKFAKTQNPSGEMSEDEVSRFAQIQKNSVSKGFGEARRLLGKMDEEVESGVDKTYDLVMSALDKFFKDPEVKIEEEENYPAEDARSYSSQSFSLSFQLEVSAEGKFNQEQLNAFIEDSMAQVQDAFKGFFGGEESEFSPMNLFNLSTLNPEKLQSLLLE